MRGAPSPGTVVVVEKLGSEGYEFSWAAYARVIERQDASSGQVSLEMLVLDQRDVDDMMGREWGYEVDPAIGFSALPRFLHDAGDEGAVAEAMWALNGERLFVKQLNESD